MHPSLEVGLTRAFFRRYNVPCAKLVIEVRLLVCRSEVCFLAVNVASTGVFTRSKWSATEISTITAASLQIQRSSGTEYLPTLCLLGLADPGQLVWGRLAAPRPAYLSNEPIF